MSGVRADGATRGDLAEATSLLVAGGALVCLPLLAVLDRLGGTWVWLSAAGALGGAIIAALGLRWFLVEGPSLVAVGPEAETALSGGDPVELPAGVRLVEMRRRLLAHALRFAALAAGALVVFVDLGPLRWGVLGLFFLSFAADQILLSPARWVLDEQTLTQRSLFGTRTIRWDEVTAVYWRHYPGEVQPPFPSGERVIIERPGEDRDLEFVFHSRGRGTKGPRFVQALAPLVGERLRILRPRDGGRAQVNAPSLADVLDDEARGAAEA